jgi:hypothetical protein
MSRNQRRYFLRACAGRGAHRNPEDKTQSMPVRNEHLHFFLPEAEIPKAPAWYAKTFGGKAGTRNNGAVVDIPGECKDQQCASHVIKFMTDRNRRGAGFSH